jgi:hypothetical protein
MQTQCGFCEKEPKYYLDKVRVIPWPLSQASASNSPNTVERAKSWNPVKKLLLFPPPPHTV